MRSVLRGAHSIDMASPEQLGTMIGRIKGVVGNLRQPVALDVPVWFRSDGHYDANWEMGPDIKMPTPAQLKAWLEARDAS